MKITKLSFHMIFLFLVLSLVFGYFLLLYTKSGDLLNLSIGMMILWAILLPLLSSIPYSFGYIICLPSPIFGTWLLLMVQTEKYVILFNYLRMLEFLLSFLLVFAVHVLTRGRTMFWKIPMASISRYSVAAISTMFLVLGFMLSNPSAFKLDAPSEIFYFSVVLLAYIASSMLYINSSYRLYVLSKRLGVLNLESELSKIWTAIEKKFPNSKNDLDMLQYYFYESLRSFLEGDFERSFIWGYKVIREKTIVDPLKYVDDKRTNKKQSFSDIRNTLEHSRRKGHVDTSKIRQIVKNLFHDCLDLLEREFVFIKKVSE